MRFPFIHKHKEGEFYKNGISYRKDRDSKLLINIKLWRFYLYLRWRANWLCEDPNSCNRFNWHWGFKCFCFSKTGWQRLQKGLEFSFDIQALKIGNIIYSIELLEDAGPLVIAQFIRNLHD